MNINNNEYDYAIIIDDDEEEEEKEKEPILHNHLEEVETKIEEQVKPKKTRNRVTPFFLKKSFFEEEDIMEIGVDEAGRGPLFGRVYTAAVVLPKDINYFDHTLMKDSKKFHSKSKIVKVAEYIKENAIDWSVTYEDEKTIDEINILQATQKSMHHSVHNILSKKNQNSNNYRTKTKVFPTSVQLLIDGNYFNPISFYDKESKKINVVPHICIEGGDNKYSAIAAASILAKVARDQYIDDLCDKYPELAEKYAIDTNKGYGAKKHLDGIKEYGITPWHRKSFGICKQYA